MGKINTTTTTNDHPFRMENFSFFQHPKTIHHIIPPRPEKATSQPRIFPSRVHLPASSFKGSFLHMSRSGGGGDSLAQSRDRYLESKRDAERRIIDRADGVAGRIDVVVEEIGYDIFSAFRVEKEGGPLWKF